MIPYVFKEVWTEKERSLELKAKKASKAITKARYNRKIKCIHCGLDNKVKKLTVNIMMYWDHNTGDPNGGFYRESNDYFVKCPKCEVESRYFEHMQQGDNWEWKKVHSYKPWFAIRDERYPNDEERVR